VRAGGRRQVSRRDARHAAQRAQPRAARGAKKQLSVHWFSLRGWFQLVFALKWQRGITFLQVWDEN